MKVSTQLNSNFCFFIFSREFHSMFSTRLIIFFFFLSFFFCMRCAICCCVLFSYTVHHQTTSLLCTITNWKKNYALQNLLNIISRAKMHTNTNTFAFVHHKKIITGRTTCNSCWTARRASGRAAAQQPTSPTLVDYLIGIVLQRPANAAAAIAKRRAIAMYQLR